MWAVPAVAWILEKITGWELLIILMLFWFVVLNSFISPVATAVGPISMALSTDGDLWETDWETTFTKGEIWATALWFFGEGGFTYYLFVKNWTEAILYYDELL